jgi:tetratricopeptide (TPR) repeat protein
VAVWAWAEREAGSLDAAVERLRSATDIARSSGNPTVTAMMLLDLSILESEVGNHELTMELLKEAVEINRKLEDEWGVLVAENNLACTLRELGRLQEAKALMQRLVPTVLKHHDARLTVAFAEDFAALLSDLGAGEACARMLGAASAMRTRLKYERSVWQAVVLEQPLAAAQAALPESVWARAFAIGQDLPVETALAELA